VSTPVRSLQGRLLGLVLGGVGAVWLAVAVFTWVDARGELDELLDSHLAQAAALLVAQQAHGDDDDGQIDAPSLHRYAPKVVFQVWHDGSLVLRSANAPTARMSQRERGFETRAIDGTDWRLFAARGAKRDVQVYVGEQMASRAAILRAVMRSVLWPMALALPLLAALVWWAVRRGLVPLRRLGALLARRAPQELQPVELDATPAEMQPLVAALNGLFERIAALLESERRFTADAAHELRTPIAAIRTQAQTALISTDDASRRHALQATLEGCDRAVRLVEQLLTLARLEQAPVPAPASIDLAGLTRRTVAGLAAVALERQQVIELDAPVPCPVRGDETLLTVLVRNLVDNAIRYSPDGARVRVALRCAAADVTLCVEDSGPGLDDAQRARLGERFFRVLGSGQPGSGLGWSIVRRIAAAQGVQPVIDASPSLGGLRVRLTWPG
jgi:two-component system sensor histidine kinase QseC